MPSVIERHRAMLRAVDSEMSDELLMISADQLQLWWCIMHEPEILKRYRSQDELARDLGVAPLTLIRWRAAGTGPPITKLGARVLYARDSTDRWLRSLEVAAVEMPPRGKRRALESGTEAA
jgi:hypothetical protein